MEYELCGIPTISKSFSYSIDQNNRIICSSEGQIKVLYCDSKIFEEFLSYVNQKLSFEEIEKIFYKRYMEEDVKDFISTLLKEKIVDVRKNRDDKKKPCILIIGKTFSCKVENKIIQTSAQEFLNDTNVFEFDYAVITEEKLSYSEIVDINRKLYRLRKVYALIRCDGENIILGSLIVPNHTGCLECRINSELKKLNKKIPDHEKINLENLLDLNYSFDIVEVSDRSKMKYLLEILISNIDSFFEGSASLLIDYQHEFNKGSMDVVKSENLPTTSCDFCAAFNKNYIIYNPSEMQMSDLLLKGLTTRSVGLNRERIHYKDGGLRTKSVVETEKILLSDFKKIGAKINITPAIGNPFHDNGIISCFNSSIETDNGLGSGFLIRKNEGAGKGITEKQSFFSAAFELLEHLCLQYRGDIPIINAAYKDVKEFAMDMELFSKTLKNQETAFDDFSPEYQMDWVVATSVTDNSPILVPASLVFMYDVELKGTFFGSTSNGAAAGTTLEDAILHGILELIERDAWIIGQSNPYVLPIVDYSTIKSDRVKKVIRNIKSIGYDVITRDYTNDIGVPVYRTWIVDRTNYSKYAYMGFGCHLSSELAIERSITEALQIDDWSETGGEVESDMIDLSVLSNSLINIYNQYYLVNRDIFGKRESNTPVEYTGIEVTSTFDAINKLATIIREKVGGEIYYVDLSKEDLDTRVVRVIITGDFQMMNIPLLSVTDRLFEFGKRCGYDTELTTYEKLFMGKYQH